MEGERAFVQDAAKLGQADLLKDNPGIAFKYNLGGGYQIRRLGTAAKQGTTTQRS